jgi:hypothetical protein
MSFSWSVVEVFGLNPEAGQGPDFAAAFQRAGRSDVEFQKISYNFVPPIS